MEHSHRANVMEGAARPGNLPHTGGTESAARAQLARVLASETFSRSARLRAFLQFVGEETIAGRGHSLKEQLIGARFYGKRVTFDPASDPTVRVDARRLRDKLREYYQVEGATDSIRIDMPKGGYVVRFFPVNQSSDRGSSLLDKLAPALAVLPFENLSKDTEQEYFADGITEGIITELARLGVMRVISRTSVMGYKSASTSVSDIAAELNVTHILKGSVNLNSERIRISCQLLRVNPEESLWAESFERDLNDVLQLLTEIALVVVRQVPNSPGPPAPPAYFHTITPRAYEAYLKGRYHFSRLTPQDLYKSREYFELAVAEAPTFAPAYAGLADAYVWLGEAVVPTKESHPKARLAAQRALELDPNLAEAWAALAGVAAGYDWDWKQAEACFRRALELNPNYALAHMGFGAWLAQIGRFEEGIQENRIAHTLDPLSAAVEVEYGVILYVTRRFEDAVRRLRATALLDPAYARAYIFLGLALIELKCWPEAIQALSTGRGLAPRMPSFLASLIYAHARAGQRAEAVRLLDDLEKLAADAYVPEFMFAWAATGLRYHDKAIAHLQRAFEERHLLFRVIGVTPAFDDLRGDPRFIDLVKRLNLPAQ